MLCLTLPKLETSAHKTGHKRAGRRVFIFGLCPAVLSSRDLVSLALAIVLAYDTRKSLMQRSKTCKAKAQVPLLLPAGRADPGTPPEAPQEMGPQPSSLLWSICLARKKGPKGRWHPSHQAGPSSF